MFKSAYYPARPQYRAGIENRICADPAPVADESTELPYAGTKSLPFDYHLYVFFFLVKMIRNDRSGFKVHVFPDD